MSAYSVSNSTLDVITRGLIKYKLATHTSINIIGQDLRRVNNHALNVRYTDNPLDTSFPEYERNPFDRKVKRAATDGAIRCWLHQCSEFPEFAESATYKLVKRLQEKNALRMGFPLGLNDDGYTTSVDANSFWDIGDREVVMVRTRAVREAEAEAIIAARMTVDSADADDDDDDDYEAWGEDNETPTDGVW